METQRNYFFIYFLLIFTISCKSEAVKGGFNEITAPLEYYSEKAKDLGKKTRDQIFDVIGDAQIIALGESAHNLHDPTLFRINFFSHLVKNYGVRTLVGETGMYEALLIDEFIKSSEAKYRSKNEYDRALNKIVLKGTTHGMGKYSEMVEMIRWMHTYNLKNKSDQLSFKGVDLLKSGDSLYTIYDHLIKEVFNIKLRVSRDFVNTLEELLRISKNANFFYSLVAKYSNGYVDPDYLDDLTSFGFESLTKNEKEKIIKLEDKLVREYFKLKKKVSNENRNLKKANTLIHLAVQSHRNLRIRDIDKALVNRESFYKKFKKALKANDLDELTEKLLYLMDDYGVPFDEKRKKIVRNIFSNSKFFKSRSPQKNKRKCKRLIERGRVENMKTCPHYTKEWESYFNGRYASREIHLAKNLMSMTKNKNKVFFFAHNGHIMKTKNVGIKAAGYYLGKVLKKKYVVIGVTNNHFIKSNLSMRDAIQSIENGDESVLLSSFYGSPIVKSSDVKNSFENIFDKYLDRNNLDRCARPYFVNLKKTRLNNVKFTRWNGGFQALKLENAFDALIYFPLAKLGITNLHQ